MFNPRNVALAAVITLVAFTIISLVFNLILCLTIGNNSDYCMSFMSDLTNGQIIINIVKLTVAFFITGYVFAVVYNRLSLKS